MSDSESTAPGESASATRDAKKDAKKAGLKKIALLTLPALILTLFAIVAMTVRLPTQFKTELVTRRLEITPRESLSLEFSGFTSLKLEEFNRFSFSPESLGVREEEDQNWKSFDFEGDINFAAEEDLPASLRLHGGKSGDTVGNLRLEIDAGRRIVFSVHDGGKELAIAVHDDDANGEGRSGTGGPARAEINVFSSKLFRMTAHNLTPENVDLPLESDVLHYLAAVAEHSSEVIFEPRADALVAAVHPGAADVKDAFPAAGVPVSALNLLYFNNRDKRFESALVKGGKLSRAGVEGEESFAAADQVLIDAPEDLRVRVAGLDAAAGGLTLRIEGQAGRLRIGSPGGTRDFGLTLFERLWRNQQLSVIFGVLFWALSTSFGLYNVYKKFTAPDKK